MDESKDVIEARSGEPSTSRAMDPNHPLLQRAQEVLKRQLVAKKLRVEGELREKQGELKARRSLHLCPPKHCTPPPCPAPGNDV